MDIGKAITTSWNLTIKHIWVVLGASLVGGLMSTASLGILFPPLAAAVMVIYLRAKRGKPVEVPNVFDCLKFTILLLLAFIWRFILIVLGLGLLIVPGLIFAAWWVFTPLFIVDQGCGISEAMRRSRELTREKIGTTQVIVFLFILAVIAGSGSILFKVGLLFTVPLALGTLALAYEEATASQEEAPEKRCQESF